MGRVLCPGDWVPFFYIMKFFTKFIDAVSGVVSERSEVCTGLCTGRTSFLSTNEMRFDRSVQSLIMILTNHDSHDLLR